MNMLKWEFLAQETAAKDKCDIYTADFSMAYDDLILAKFEFQLNHYQTPKGHSDVTIAYCSYANSYEEWVETGIHYDTIEEGEAAAEEILKDLLNGLRKMLNAVASL